MNSLIETWGGIPGPSSSTTIVTAVLDSEDFIVIVLSLGVNSREFFKTFPKACSRSIFSANTVLFLSILSSIYSDIFTDN